MKIHPSIYPGLAGCVDPEAQTVQGMVCKILEVDPLQLSLPNRKRELVEARGLIFYVLRRQDKKKWSYVKLGALYNLDHSTAIWGIHLIKNLLQTNKDFRSRIGKFIEIE